MTISGLVRSSLQEHYMQGKCLDKAALARNLTGIWKNRKDLQDINAAIRKLGKGSRLKRLHIGRHSSSYIIPIG